MLSLGFSFLELDQVLSAYDNSPSNYKKGWSKFKVTEAKSSNSVWLPVYRGRHFEDVASSDALILQRCIFVLYSGAASLQQAVMGAGISINVLFCSVCNSCLAIGFYRWGRCWQILQFSLFNPEEEGREEHITEQTADVKKFYTRRL